MSAPQLIAALDSALLEAGQSATLRRRIGTGLNTFVDLAIRVRLQGYATTDLVAGIKVTDSKFIASPTPIVAAGAAWPGAAGGGADIKIGDFILVEGRQRAVVQVDNIRIGDVLVRIEGRVSG
ncbi:MAG TPA: hypothetical protein VGO06_13710 [Bosea sp. (in: a-proteobacteria)]|jgi:hypothetical protein|uniref:hypothetical protein n=1 Tax=Bosea sp. (in: a-proteobacteria) TaxID=1871050 RepID=UPI002E12411D|nr:hypothetical protein [Bosea sp. (in: a-proteobacteria)]